MCNLFQWKRNLKSWSLRARSSLVKDSTGRCRSILVQSPPFSQPWCPCTSNVFGHCRTTLTVSMAQAGNLNTLTQAVLWMERMLKLWSFLSALWDRRGPIWNPWASTRALYTWSAVSYWRVQPGKNPILKLILRRPDLSVVPARVNAGQASHHFTPECQPASTSCISDSVA